MKKKIFAVLLLALISVTGITVTAAAEDYIYCVGSVSKVYAAAAVMKLADEGKVDIDAPVTEYIPDFTLDDERYRDITVRMLMDHTSGIMGTTQLGAFCYEHGALHDDMFLKLLSKQRLKADPGEYAAYCNDGFDLLALIVENVTGMDYTDYVRAELASPTGGRATGSAVDFEKLGTPAPSYTPGNLHMDFGVTEAIGAGGIYSAAEDVADFGAGFFEGSKVLLSEKAKREMVIRWNEGSDDDPYKDGSGLGWDEVQLAGYEETGVQVLLKGGDALMNHAALMVAPKEEISVAVLSNGGSSALNALLADALLQTVLEERGIKKASEESEEYELAADIPAGYDEFEGFYSSEDSSGGAVILHVTFPDHKYMHVESIGPARRTTSDLMLIQEVAETGNGRFAELAYEIDTDVASSVDEQLLDARTAADPEILSFVEGSDGEIYLRADYANVFPELGRKENRKYIGEKMGGNPVGQ
ncbi:MAG: beta-lactamase family protein, partial [Lachnospiraceae bacterium]|nr:beta-lactamase family protein [Lachnospiraceae bacterium]